MHDQPANAASTATLSSDEAELNRDEMLRLLGSADAEAQTQAAHAFYSLRDDRAIAPLIALLESPDPSTRVSAAYALGHNISPDAIEPLIQCLGDDDSAVRKGAVWALGNCGDLRALDPLVHALRHDIPAVRLWASSSLGQLARLGYDFAVAAVPPLLVSLRTDETPAIRSNSAWALGQLCRELPSNVVYAGAIDGLLDAFEDDADVGVREDARASLLRVGDPRGLQAIEDVAARDDAWE